MRNTTLEISEIIGKNSAILHSDGLALYDKMKSISDSVIVLSFKGINYCTTAFLNASIGKFLVEDPNRVSVVQFTDFTNGEFIKDKIDLVLENARDEKKRTSEETFSRNLFYA